MRTLTRPLVGAVVAGAAICLVLTSLPAAGATTAATAGTAACSTDWTTYQRTVDRAGSTCSTAVSRTTVSTLTPRWFVRTKGAVTAEPSVVGNALYVGDGVGVMRALNATTGAVQWRFNVRDNTTHVDRHAASYGVIVSSATVAPIPGVGRTVFFGGGGTLYALDAFTGTARWAIDIDPAFPTSPAEIESSPVLWTMRDGTPAIAFGMDTNEATGTASGGIVALNARTGALLWKYDAETSAVVHDLTARDQEGTGCGDVWSSPAYDPSTRFIYFGIGNCDTPPTDTQHLTAIDADSGLLAWKFIEPPANHGIDRDFGATPVLATDGTGRRLVVQAGKSGWVYVVNARTGALVRQVKVARGSSIGGFIGSPAVTVHDGHLVLYGNTAIPASIDGTPALISPRHPLRSASLHAVDLVTGRLLWHEPLQVPAYSPVTHANGVVFAPDTTGFAVNAYDAATGAPLWRVPMAAAPSGGVTVSGDSVYVGAGTYFSPDTQVPPQVTGIWGFRLPSAP